MQLQWSFTGYEPAFPTFLNITKTDHDTIIVTVRELPHPEAMPFELSDAKGPNTFYIKPGDMASMEMPIADFRKLLKLIAADLLAINPG